MASTCSLRPLSCLLLRRSCSIRRTWTLVELFHHIDLFLSGNDDAVLNSYSSFIRQAAMELGLDCSGIMIAPSHTKKITTHSSPHIFKCSKTQYEIRTYRRIFRLFKLTGVSAGVYLQYIEMNIPEGVSMVVKKVALEPMPQVLKKIIRMQPVTTGVNASGVAVQEAPNNIPNGSGPGPTLVTGDCEAEAEDKQPVNKVLPSTTDL